MSDTVWIIWEHSFADEPIFVGVFATKEAAETYVSSDAYPQSLEIVERPLLS